MQVLPRTVTADRVVLFTGRHSLLFFGLHLLLLPAAVEISLLVVGPVQKYLPLWGTQLAESVIVTGASMLLLSGVVLSWLRIRAKTNNHVGT
ncbi:MAG: hypothetical protein TR69_WS6001001369 [candidate division WS6 bacterium OLB20]|uniref:Uncharacterized protein n=1 Tax=candidate division WS6 bacterium OLB20 TaxID=1617426 RepID=A0A136LWP9_9BACT|nr:MAG: hypothetical protein TR69_WS6001001369 [candidate division WS6 bacterium OLB20]